MVSLMLWFKILVIVCNSLILSVGFYFISVVGVETIGRTNLWSVIST